jgi:hypothetical protein
MKKYILFLIIIPVIVLTGCDSPSGSKPDPVTRPELVSPENNATNVPLTPLFKWTGEANIIQVATNPNFGANDVKHTAAISGQQYNMPAGVLQNGIRYYWRVGKSTGSTTDWSSSIFSFVTVN